MAHRSFEHEIRINAPVNTICDFLAAQVNHTKIHPLILAIEPLPDDPAREHTRFYQITDQLKFGPLTWKLKYKSAVTLISPNELMLEAFQSMLYLRNKTRCTPDGEGTRVQESVTIQTSPLLMGYAFHEADGKTNQEWHKLNGAKRSTQ